MRMLYLEFLRQKTEIFPQGEKNKKATIARIF